jgi:lycopene cyclase domain-containing protein
MPPARLEYLFVLLIYFGSGATILWSALRRLFLRRYFWISAAAFEILGTAVDLLAIRWGWWAWMPDRTCGMRILAIPIEEYLGFFIGHMLVVGGWENLRDDMA